MTENFDLINAPQFFDFNKDLHKDDNIDSYFDIDHENTQSQDPLEDVSIENTQSKDPPQNVDQEYVQLMSQLKDTYNESIQSEDLSEDPLKFRHTQSIDDEEVEFYSPLKATPGYINNLEENDIRKPRRSISVGDMKLLCENECMEVKEISAGIQKLTTNYKPAQKKGSLGNIRKADSNMSLNKVGKTGPMRTSAPRLSKAASKENLNRLAQPKRYGSAQNLSQGNYVSMAEAVKKFQSGTPTRFRSKPKFMSHGKPELTVPQSPALTTKNRHRPVQAMSREEQEQLEFEKAQKFKIKAHPLNKKILQGPIKPMVPIEKKPATIVEPFKLTAPPTKKVADSPKKQSFEFHAHPVPKGVYEPPKLKEIQKHIITTPQTPKFMKRYVKEHIKPQQNQEEPKPAVKLEKTIPMPFSFEHRDQNIQKRREELLKRVLEEEKKAREFHARPAPKAILNRDKNSSNGPHSNSSLSSNSLTASEEKLATQFKAKPPTVLYKKPFVPKKERHLIEITEFELNTEKRAKEREEFEKFKKEKEEKIALTMQLEEEIRMRQEEEETARLRKEMEYKAQGIKKYKEVNIQPSGKVTVPRSPKFHINRSKTNENKENSN